jgi:Domain of unknown function (DUF4062)
MDAISVFISSKQSEFETERAVLADKIRSIPFLDVVLAEEWAPERTPVQDVFLEKVRRCPIYVGLFQCIYSEPTEMEYRAGMENPYREVLLYIKGCRGTRDPRLAQLIDAARSRHVTFQFDGVKDLLPVFRLHLQAALVRMVENLQALGKQEPVSRSTDSVLQRRWAAQQRHLRALGLPEDHTLALDNLERAVAALRDLS